MSESGIHPLHTDYYYYFPSCNTNIISLKNELNEPWLTLPEYMSL